MPTPSQQVKPNTLDLVDQRRTQTLIQICIPKHLREEAIISRLVSHYAAFSGWIPLTVDPERSRSPEEFPQGRVNIAATQMDEGLSQEDSCSTLELRGLADQ